MSLPHAHSGEVVTLPCGTSLGGERTTVLVKTDALEVIRLVMPAGKQIPAHQAPGPITVQCLEGRVEFATSDSACELAPGSFLYLESRKPHSLRAIDDTSLLVTIVF